MDSRRLGKVVAVLVPAIALGALVAAQWTTVTAPSTAAVSIRYIDPLTQTVDRLEKQQTSLKEQVTTLRGRLSQLERTGARQTGAAREVGARIDDLRASAGLTDVRGTGVRMRLDAPAPPAGAPADVRAPCLAPDITDLVNAAWRGGATAVAVDDERVVVSSSVYCVGATIVVNGSIITAPFTVSAVGSPSAILAVVNDPAELQDLKRRRDQQMVSLTIAAAPLVDLPPFSGPLGTRVAVPQ